MGQTEGGTHHDIVATDDDQAGQGEIDHCEEALPPGVHRGVLIRVGGRSLGKDVERVVHDSPDHGLQRTHNLLCHPLGGILQPAGSIKRVEARRRWRVCVGHASGGSSSTQTDLEKKCRSWKHCLYGLMQSFALKNARQNLHQIRQRADAVRTKSGQAVCRSGSAEGTGVATFADRVQAYAEHRQHHFLSRFYLDT